MGFSYSPPGGGGGGGGGGLSDFEVKFTFIPADLGQADDFITATTFELPLPIPAGDTAWVTGTSNGKDGFYLSTGDAGGGNTGFEFDLDPLVIGNVGRSIHVNSDGEGNPHYYEITTNDGSTIVADEIARLAVTGDGAATAAALDTLTTRFEQQFPLTPVKPNRHRSKYVTFDPGAAGSGPGNHHLLDGTATHVGGQAIEEGQNLTVANNANGHGGIWTLHLGDVAERATGLGSVPGDKIGGYDEVMYTGTVWAEETDWRIVTSDPTQYGIDLIDQAWPITRSNFRPSLIATDLTGTTLTVLDPDGTTASVDVGDLDDVSSPTCDVLVLDDLTLITIDAGSVVETEDFSDAEGIFTARGEPGDRSHAGTVVSVTAGAWTRLSS